MEVDLQLSNRAVDIVTEGYDLAFRVAAQLADSSLRARKLLTVPKRAYASREYAHRLGWDIEAQGVGGLRELTWLRRSGAPRRLALTHPQHPQTEDIRTRSCLSCSSYGVLLEGALAGLGAVMVPDWFVLRHPLRARFTELAPGWTGGNESIWAVWPEQRFLPRRIRVLVQFLADRLGEMFVAVL